MPRVNFGNGEPPQEYLPLPPGTYECRLAEVKERLTQRGDEMWQLRFVVRSGEHAGHYIWDTLFFSEAALTRVKRLCESVGVDASGEMDLTPEPFIGKLCNVTVRIERGNGKGGPLRNKVTFLGYAPLEETQEEDATPF
jgi:hypothetical protein